MFILVRVKKIFVILIEVLSIVIHKLFKSNIRISCSFLSRGLNKNNKKKTRKENNGTKQCELLNTHFESELTNRYTKLK